MAKKITPNEDGAESVTQPTPAPESSPLEQVPETAPGAEKKPETIPDFADRILRTFPGYAELYIDQHGGTFTVDSPPALRAAATRYTNPYHKS